MNPNKLRASRLMTGLLAALQIVAPVLAQAPAPGLQPPGTEITTLATPQATAADGRILPWGGIQHSTGPGIGYRTSYTSLQGFLPAYQTANSILFADLRGWLSNSAVEGANLGGGYRYFLDGSDRLVGVNAYFDNRNTGRHSFNQVGFGFESLGAFWDFRANGYVAVGDESKESSALFTNPTFVQNNILLDRFGFGQSALSGFDAEVGTAVSCALGLRAFLGTYNYQGDNIEQAWGARARIEWRPTENIDFNLAVSNDREFDTSVVFQAGFRFGGGSRREGAARCNTYARRADRVERNSQVVVADTTVVTQELACDPVNGGLLTVFHADSNAAAGGNGTFEMPFQTLAALQAGSTPNTILLAHAGSIFDAQSITLQTGQRFLGDGATCRHLFTACQGTLLLPRANGLAAQPQINNAPGDAITLASNTEVSGFIIQNAGNNAIFGPAGISNVLITCNQIVTPGTDGVQLTDVTGTINIANNIFTGSGGDQIDIELNAGTANVFITRNTFTDADDNAIELETPSGATAVLNGTIAGNLFVNPGSDAIRAESSSDDVDTNNSDWNWTVANNTFQNIGNDALEVVLDADGDDSVSRNNTVMTWSITGNSFNGTGADAIFFNVDADDSAINRADVTLAINNNIFQNIGADGINIDIDNDDDATENTVWNVTVLNNQFNTIANAGIEIDIDTEDDGTSNATMTWTVANNTFQNITQSSIEVEMGEDGGTNNAVVTMFVRNNALQSNGDNVFEVDTENNSTFNAQVFANTFNAPAGSNAIDADQDDVSTHCWQITGNTTTGNFNFAADIVANLQVEDTVDDTNIFNPPATGTTGAFTAVAPGTCFPAP